MKSTASEPGLIVVKKATGCCVSKLLRERHKLYNVIVFKGTCHLHNKLISVEGLFMGILT